MRSKKRAGMLIGAAVALLSACGPAGQVKGNAVPEEIAGIEDDAAPEGTASEGAAPEGTMPEGGAHEGTMPEGGASKDVTPKVPEDTASGSNGLGIKDGVPGQGGGTDEEPATGESGMAAENPAIEEGQVRYAEEGMRLSIFGDSISTFEGWIPEGNSAFFPNDGAVQDVSETWWEAVLDGTGMTLCANGSSSGSTCCGDSRTADVMVGCCDYRISQLAGAGGEVPDIIILYMGTNDVVQHIPIGDNDGLRPVEEGIVDNFSDAYSLILDKLERQYPAAQIYCCTLLPVGSWGTDRPFVTFYNGQNLTSEDYSQRILTIAQNRKLPVIDLYHCGINIDNMPEMTTDGVHPTPAGMRCIADTVLNSISTKTVR